MIKLKAILIYLWFPKQKMMAPFLIANFFRQGFSTLHSLDRHSNFSGIILYVREDIPATSTAIENKPMH